MKLRRIALAWGVALSLFVLVGHMLFSTYIIEDGFREIERRHIQDKLTAAQHGIDSVVNQLDIFVWDWSSWDDTYVFAQDENQQYITSNLVTSTFTAQDLTAVVIRNRKGWTVYARAVDNEGADAPKLLAALNESIEKRLPRLSKDDTFRGLIRLGDVFYITATRPILTSDGGGPVMGTLTMVRTLSNDIIQSISANVGRPVGFAPPEAQRQLLNLIAASGAGEAIHYVDDAKALGARLHPTLNREDGGLVIIEFARDITQYGHTVVAYNGMIITLSILLLATISYVFLNTKFVKRLERIKGQVTTIHESTSDQHYVEVDGKDEITDLSNSINTLLANLRTAHRMQIDQGEEIAASERFLSQILNSISVGILIVDPETREIVEINDFVLKLAGRKREEVIGHICHKLTCPAEVNQCPILDLHQSSDLSKRKLLTKDGGEIPIMKSVSHVDRHGRDLLLETIIDITDIEEARLELERIKESLEDTVASRTRELKEANKELVALDRAKTLFLSSASHELRTPLTSVLGFLKLMEKKFKKRFYQHLTSDESLKEHADQFVDNLEVVRSEAERLGRLVNDLLSLNKIESGRMEWRDEWLNVASVLNHAAEAYSGHAAHKEHVDLIVEQPPAGVGIHADKDRLLQVLINLMSNAFKFTEQGHIKLSATEQGQFVNFAVSDTGKGIAEEDRKQVFDLFYQVHDENRRSSKEFGTGLGLAICRQIVTHYGGTISVESVEGEGSTFSFTIPKA